MYTGELINELLENVQDAERKVVIGVAGARSTETHRFDAYMYDVGRDELVGVA